MIVYSHINDFQLLIPFQLNVLGAATVKVSLAGGGGMLRITRPQAGLLGGGLAIDACRVPPSKSYIYDNTEKYV